MRDFGDGQRRLQINLHSAAGLESLERDRIRSFQTPRPRQKLHRQVVMQNVPPFALRRDRAAQHFLASNVLCLGNEITGANVRE